MTTSILRTADAWYVQTDTGAAKIDTAATTTGELLGDRAADRRGRRSAAAPSPSRPSTWSPPSPHRAASSRR